MTLRAPSVIAVSALLLSSLLVVSGPPATAADPRVAFTQPELIDVNDDDAFFRQETPISVPSSGTATPYPSQITIDHGGLVTIDHGGLVTSVEVRLTGVTHTRPDDLDIMLVGPTATSVVLMSDAGGDNDFDNFFLGFNDPGEFTDPLPDEDAVTAEDFQPTPTGRSSPAGTCCSCRPVSSTWPATTETRSRSRLSSR